MEHDLEKIHAALDKVSDQLKAQAESAKKEIEKHQALSAETREAVDKLLTEQGALMGRLQAAEQLVATLQATGFGGFPDRPQTMGEQMAEAEVWKAFCADPKGSVRVRVNAAITTDSGGSQSDYSGDGWIAHDRVPGIIMPALRRLTIRDLLAWGRTTSNSVDYVRETGFTNSAAPVSENPAEGKPESQITFEADQAPVATVGHWIHASRQILSDVPMLQSYVDGRMRYGLKLVEENQLLNGSGAGLNIAGLVTQATEYANPGVTVAAETRIDRLRLALLQVELAEYFADGIVLHPTDWAAIELTKDSQNRYIFANPNNVTTPNIWGRNVVPTQAMGTDDFLVGAFSMGAQGWDREDVSVLVSLEDRDNVIKNMVTILVEERLALTVYRPESFVKGDFSGLSTSG